MARKKHQQHDEGDRRFLEPLVTVEAQRETDLLSGALSERIFLKLYVQARTSGLLSAISDRDWKTLCVLATYMNGDGYCFPSQAEIARAIGCSRQMANERIKSLANFRFQGKPVLLIEKKERGARGTWTRNGYHILPISQLSIFDHDTGSSGDASAGRGNASTVSRKLDTVDENESTVSSSTGTVGLDTNKNQLINKIGNSNIRMPSASISQESESTTITGSVIEEVNDHNGTPRQSYDPDRELIRDYVEDFAREFNDTASQRASTTRTMNMFRRSGVTRDQFVESLLMARSITKERTAAIRSREPEVNGYSPKRKMGYFFAVLEDLLGLRNADQAE